jgi:hypothetical protein
MVITPINYSLGAVRIVLFLCRNDMLNPMFSTGQLFRRYEWSNTIIPHLGVCIFCIDFKGIICSIMGLTATAKNTQKPLLKRSLLIKMPFAMEEGCHLS